MDVQEHELCLIYSWVGAACAHLDNIVFFPCKSQHPSNTFPCMQVDEMPLSRPKRNIHRDFADGGGTAIVPPVEFGISPIAVHQFHV